MTDKALYTESYADHDGQVSWGGVGVEDGIEFTGFMTGDVASRLNDQEGGSAFEAHLRGLANTGFANDSLNEVLNASIHEERDWAVGEAIAEAYLSNEHSVVWPWNSERDKRTPMASLPGADLIGFKNDGRNVELVLGEVKTSGDEEAPPNVMYGRSGMTHQIDKLASDLSLVSAILRWLLPRCRGTAYETLFDSAVKLFLSSGNKAVALFGVLVRDTKPNELDLKARGQALARRMSHPTTCQLIALYLPCEIAILPQKVKGE